MKRRYVQTCESLGWSVSVCESGFIAELEKYSPAGEDFICCIAINNFVENVKEYFEGFDPEEHVRLLLEAKLNGFKGVPDIKTLTEDAFAIQDMLEDLAIALVQAEAGVQRA